MMRHAKVMISGICLFTAIVLENGFKVQMVGDLLFYIATIVAGIDVLRHAIAGLRNRTFGIEMIVTIAVVGAIWIGEVFEAAMVTFLFMFGSYLEQRALRKTRVTIQQLFDVCPDIATVLRDDCEESISAEDVQQGDIVIVRPGNKVPADGFVKTGTALVNQSAITGESCPIRKKKDDYLYSGSLIESGYVTFVADKVSEQTTLAGILRMIETAEETKAPMQKTIERFARYYTPFILLLAVIVYFLTGNLIESLTLLVISCPGALVIAAPVSIVAGIGLGAKLGALFKGGESIERFAKINVIAFDKTGTLTIGKPRVTGFMTYRGSSELFWHVVASAELPSEHYLAKAIVHAARNQYGQLRIAEPDSFHETSGMGIEATVDGMCIWLGNKRFLQKNGVEIAGEDSQDESVVYVADTYGMYGVIYVSDEIREDACESIKRLKASGIKKVVMLTGDHEIIARKVANDVGVDEVYAGLLPGEKMSAIQQLQARGYRVAMVGDGINDGPSLAAADIGISLYSGTDLAMQHAGVILVQGKLASLVDGLILSRNVRINMNENIFGAVGVAVLLIIGVFFRQVFLASGMLVHELSILAVVLNALRLRVPLSRRNRGILHEPFRLR